MAPIPARLPRTRTPRADLPGARGANNAPPPPPPQTFIALLDNYERETGIAERTTQASAPPRSPTAGHARRIHMCITLYN